MSTQHTPAPPSSPPPRRITAPQIRARKGSEQPIVALTAYHAHTARLADNHVDLLLVGDSLGMVLYGHGSTLPVTLEQMITHGRVVASAVTRALVVVDMPFGSYEESPQQAFRNAARVLKETGAAAVKLEGGARMAETIHFLTRRGVPVMAHVGLTPQSVNTLGGFFVQGRDEAQWDIIEDDARAVAEAGAFCVVLEAVAEALARRITASCPAPTIGIGASAACDGQILVMEDMLGLNPNPPKFVKEYADLTGVIDRAIAEYAADVRARRFPAPEHVYDMKKRQ